MEPSKSTLDLTRWSNLICTLMAQGTSTAIGLFDADGGLQYANTAMRYFLDVTDDHPEPKNFFVNPPFTSFTIGEGKIFEGYLTIGNFSDVSYTLISKVFRSDQQLLVFAEPNVPELFHDNTKMSEMNQQINNLQRQLMKEKRALETTLTKLQETQQMLIHSEKMNAMGKLVAGVAHELNNPIAFVYSNLHSLSSYFEDLFLAFTRIENAIQQTGNDGLKTEVQRIRQDADFDYLEKDMNDILSESKTGINRLKSLVEDLRRFSRLDEADSKTIDLIENIRSTVSIVNAQIAQKNIRFAFTGPEKLEVDCYPGQLNQAILNILINAIQAVPDQGEVRLSVQSTGSHLQITIEDNGPGIPAAIQSRIFEPFFTTKDVGSGTGLGLSITYTIIHTLHKGSITVQSDPGNGTSFCITIPLKQEKRRLE